MTYANGRLPASALASIGNDLFLAKPTANAWVRVVADVKAHGYFLQPVNGIAAAYRPYAMQGDMHIHPARYNLSKASTVAIAAAGYSSHGFATRIDIVSNMPLSQLLVIMAKHGFIREFGAADPNHYEHDGKTSTSALVAAIKRPAAKKAPKARKVHVVHSGETLGKIAEQADLTLPKLLRLNPKIKNPNLIKVGQKVYVS